MDPNPIKSSGVLLARVRDAIEPTLLRAGFRLDHRNDPRVTLGPKHRWIHYARGQERLSLDWDDWKAKLSLMLVDEHGTIHEIAVVSYEGAHVSANLLDRTAQFILAVQSSPM